MTVLNRFLNVKQTREELQTLGLSLWVEVEFADNASDQSPKRINGIAALIDTGANRSAISPRLKTKLNVLPTDTRFQIVNGIAQNVEMFRGKVIYPNGIYTIADFSILPYLAEPHDILICRDMLSITQLTVDFASGNRMILFNVAHDSDPA
jgi:hypothetical protein